MSKYEIMLILDPRADIQIANNLGKKSLGSGFSEFKKMERSKLSYEINKSNQAIYLIAEFEADNKAVDEFTRLANIEKLIWRVLAINLNRENGYEKKWKEKKIHRRVFKENRTAKKPYVKAEKKPIGKDE